MQVDGQFNLTNGYAIGLDLHVGGTANGSVQSDGLVAVTNLILGYNANSTNTSEGAYSLRSGWLIVGDYEGVGGYGNGTLDQTGGTNSAGRIRVSLGKYNKTGGAIFAGGMKVFAGVASWG